MDIDRAKGTIAWCYASGYNNPNQKKPPMTAGIPGSAAWKSYRAGQRAGKKAVKKA